MRDGGAAASAVRGRASATSVCASILRSIDFIIHKNPISGKTEDALRVLLVQSPTGRGESLIYPVGIAFLAGQLEGHEVDCLDPGLHPDPPAALAREIDRISPDVVGVSLRNIDDSAYPETYSYLGPFEELLAVLEERDVTLVVGGTGFSIYARPLLERYPRIDYGIPGEGELVLPALLSHLECGGGVPGWDGGRLLPRDRPDLAALAPPRYDLMDPADYPAPGAIGVQSRRGCPFGCTYCTYGFLGGRSFRLRPVEQVVGDLRSLASLGASGFMFTDSVFNRPENYFEELVEAVGRAETGLSWGAWLDEGVTREQLEAMAAAGAVSVDFSPDAITGRGMRALGKRGDPRELLPAVRAARSAGLRVGVNFFSGNPREGMGALLLKLLFMLRARLTLGWSDTFVNIGTIRVYEHSPMAESMRREGLLPPDDDLLAPRFCRARGPADWLYRLFQRIRKARHGG